MKCKNGIGFGLVMVGTLSLGGCQKPLFTDADPRTPYERYQVLHSDYRPAKADSMDGRREPALRERLKPLDR